MGISVADQGKLFQEFQQADNSTTRKKGGTGLGLAISKRIIELHKGKSGLSQLSGKVRRFSSHSQSWLNNWGAIMGIPVRCQNDIGAKKSPRHLGSGRFQLRPAPWMVRVCSAGSVKQFTLKF
jgi:hypothetical protein